MRLLLGTALVGGMILGCAGPGDTGAGLFGDGDGTPDPATTDSDGDGIKDAEEADLGTDPDKADSDGDGWDDKAEVDGNTDPTDDGDHPYEGGWPIASCRGDIEGEGTAEGDVSTEIIAEDQFGEDVSLYAFCDKEVYLVFAAFW